MPLVEPRRWAGDAQLALGVALSADVALAVFLLAPAWTGDDQPPAGLDLVWMLGAATTVFLGPVAAGLAAYADLITLGMHGRALDPRARRLHLVSLGFATAFFAGLALAWTSGGLAWLAD